MIGCDCNGRIQAGQGAVHPTVDCVCCVCTGECVCFRIARVLRIANDDDDAAAASVSVCLCLVVRYRRLQIRFGTNRTPMR